MTVLIWESSQLADVLVKISTVLSKQVTSADHSCTCCIEHKNTACVMHETAERSKLD